jgi:hypothetical protein
MNKSSLFQQNKNGPTRLFKQKRTGLRCAAVCVCVCVGGGGGGFAVAAYFFQRLFVVSKTTHLEHLQQDPPN